MNEREFGYQIKQQLDRTLELEPTTLNRLKAARELAVAHQRKTQPVFEFAWADALGVRFGGNAASMRVALAGAALIAALAAVQYWQQSPTVEEIEEIDAALLTSDLPINAYLDKSFDTWLKRSQH